MEYKATRNIQTMALDVKPRRLTVRLPADMAVQLAAKSREYDQTPSQIVRNALAATLSLKEPDPGAIANEVVNEISGPDPDFPPVLADLLPKYRCYGERLWPERRRLVHSLLAAAEVAQENGENPQDERLRNDLLALAKRFGLI